MKEFIEKHARLLVFIIFVFGIFLASINLWNNVTFTYDQGRDAQRILDIVSMHHFLKLVGPETNIPGVFNGVLFYYLLAPVYAISSFNPNFVAFFMILINAASVFVLYYFSQVLFKNKAVGVLACFFWVISYEQANYARFISNASFMEITSLIFFLGLALYFLKEKDIGLPLSVIGFSLAVQSNFYLIYLAIFYPLCFLFLRKKLPGIKNTLVSIGLLLLFFAPYIVAELKWHFLATRALLSFATGQSTFVTIVDGFSRYLISFSTPIYYSFFSFNVFLGFLITVPLIIYSYFLVKDKKIIVFFYFCLFSSLPLFGFSSGVLQGEIVNGPILPFLMLIYALSLVSLFNTRNYKLLGAIILAIIIFSNTTMFVKTHFMDVSVFNVNPPLILKDEENAIDYTYQSEHGKPFSICAVTNPLFINTLWGYLYNWYGVKQYGYLPFWSGQPQFLNGNVLPYDTTHVQDRYLFIEPLGGLPKNALEATVYLEDNTSRLDAIKQFGSITVEKRTLQTDPHIFLDTQKLKKSEISTLKTLVGGEPRYTCFTTYSQSE
jgi:hypothetical protein